LEGSAKSNFVVLLNFSYLKRVTYGVLQITGYVSKADGIFIHICVIYTMTVKFFKILVEYKW